MIRVLVAEDSQAARLLLVSMLEADPDIEVVGEGGDGEAAVAAAKRLRPDVVTMDIHMPRLDGLEATARIMNEAPMPIVVVSAAVSARDVASTFDALKAGALAALPKPVAGGGAAGEEERQGFVAIVKAMSRVKVVRRWSGAFATVGARGAPPKQQDRPVGDEVRNPSTAPITPSTRRATLVAIAASTGGPTALQEVLSGLPGSFAAPVVVVQHIAKGFIPGFASWLDGECELRVKLAEPDEPLVAGTVYIAPDDRHLGVTPARRIKEIEGKPVNGFCPSASVLFESAADAYGDSLAAVIMTGMGSDGVSGLRRVIGKGGYVIAQDEASSLIYGMPGEAVAAGVVDISLPLNLISTYLQKLVR
ncbi:MAG: chemotaxis-specific protein-glutamate methyltransferase CheB [Gemmatimonadaceae bacterium]